MRFGFLNSVGLVAVVIASPAFAQTDTAPPPATPSASGTTVYDREFFATYSPRTALDIVARVPGFQLDEGNSGIRGFTGAAGNVVFNGARPSSKAESLSTILARIPASRVVRVEMGSGSLYGSEYAGKTQVLNVILSAEGGFDGTFSGSLRTLYTGELVPNLAGSATWKSGNSAFNVAAGTENDDSADEGTDTITDYHTGLLVEKRRKANRYRPENPFIAATWSFDASTPTEPYTILRQSRPFGAGVPRLSKLPIK